MCGNCGHRCRVRYDQQVCRARNLRVAGWIVHVEFKRWRVQCPGCGGVHVERLDWLVRNPRYTERFALHVGNLCRSMTNQAVSELERLHDSTVKDLSKRYMAEQVRRAGMPTPRAIGVDEIAIHKGYDYRVVVSDLERGRPIWFGGSGRTEADIDQFFADLGPNKSARIEVAVMAEPALATAGALPEVRAHDRAPLGRHRRLLPSGQQGQPGHGGGLNNKIRVIQRSAYGYRDEDYLKLKIIASFLPPLPEKARLHPH